MIQVILCLLTAQVAESVVSLGGVPHLTTMLMSSHVRMLNEAIIALTVMAAVLGEDAVHAQGRYSTVVRHLGGGHSVLGGQSASGKKYVDTKV